jgi:hypothetical protein
MKVNLIPFLLIFVSCTTEIQNSSPSKKVENNLTSIVYYDSLHVELQLDTTSCLNESEFHPLFIGKLVDSIYLSYNQNFIKKIELEHSIFPNFKVDNINIFIDTSQFIASRELHGKWVTVDNEHDSEFHSNEIHLKSYPVIIKNIGTKDIVIGYGNHLPIIMVAQDSIGNWKSIQKFYTYTCGTGMMFPYLNENEILITSCKLFDGDFTTKIRLKYGWDESSYSNEFVGKIKYSQFTHCSSMW